MGITTNSWNKGHVHSPQGCIKSRTLASRRDVWLAISPGPIPLLQRVTKVADYGVQAAFSYHWDLQGVVAKYKRGKIVQIVLVQGIKDFQARGKSGRLKGRERRVDQIQSRKQVGRPGKDESLESAWQSISFISIVNYGSKRLIQIRQGRPAFVANRAVGPSCSCIDAFLGSSKGL